MSGKLMERLLDLKLSISHAERSVLMALARWANADGTSCFPSMDTIQELAKSSRSSVVRCIEGLRRHGIVSAEHRRGRKGNRYIINIAEFERRQRHPEGQSDMFVEIVLPSDSKKRRFPPRNSPMAGENSPTIGLDSVRTPSVAKATAAPSAAEPPPKPSLTDKELCFSEGVQTVIRLTAMQPDQARDFLGKMLARTANSHARVLAILRQCEAECVVNPRGWIMSKLGGDNVVRGEFGEAVRRPRRPHPNDDLVDKYLPAPSDDDESGPIIDMEIAI